MDMDVQAEANTTGQVLGLDNSGGDSIGVGYCVHVVPPGDQWITHTFGLKGTGHFDSDDEVCDSMEQIVAKLKELNVVKLWSTANERWESPDELLQSPIEGKSESALDTLVANLLEENLSAETGSP